MDDPFSPWAAPSSSPDSLVLVLATRDPVRASYITAMLAGEGVRVHGEARNLPHGALLSMPGQHQVYVAARDAGRARLIIKDLEAAST